MKLNSLSPLIQLLKIDFLLNNQKFFVPAFSNFIKKIYFYFLLYSRKFSVLPLSKMDFSFNNRKFSVPALHQSEILRASYDKIFKFCDFKFLKPLIYLYLSKKSDFFRACFFMFHMPYFQWFLLNNRKLFVLPINFTYKSFLYIL